MHVFSKRFTWRSAFEVLLTLNPFLAISVVVAVPAHIGASASFTHDLFYTTPISLQHWAVTAGVGALIIVFVEIEKFFLRCKDRHRGIAGV